MRLSIGNKVVYPRQGPCRIDHVTRRVIGGQAIMFYQLVVLDDHGGELFVPVDKAQAIGVRQMLGRSEIPKLLSHLKTGKGNDDWKQRALDNSKRFDSGSAFDMAKVVGSLTERKKTKVLSLSEARTLERARKLLICEVAEVTGETRTAAEEQIDKALEAPRQGSRSAKNKTRDTDPTELRS